MPISLNQAYTIAKLQETFLKTLQQEFINTKKPFLTPTNTSQTKYLPRNTPLLPKPPYNSTNTTKNFIGSSNFTKLRSGSDFDERRTKGLCFWCNEKYEPGHKCRQRQVYLMEINERSDEERE